MNNAQVDNFEQNQNHLRLNHMGKEQQKKSSRQSIRETGEEGYGPMSVKLRCVARERFRIESRHGSQVPMKTERSLTFRPRC